MTATQVHTELGHMLPGAGGMGAGGDPLSRGQGGNQDGAIAQELGLLLRNRSHSRIENMLGAREMPVPVRSGSAPPSVEGSLAAMGGLFAKYSASRDNGTAAMSRAPLGPGLERAESFNELMDNEHELRSDPNYLSYYYSKNNLNPRLPQPLNPRDKHTLQRLQAGAMVDSMGKMRAMDDSQFHGTSFFSVSSMLPTHREEREEGEDDDRLLSGMVPTLGRTTSADWIKEAMLGGKPKSLVDLIQEDFPRTPSPVFTNRTPSRVGGSGEDTVDSAAIAEMQLSHLRETISTMSEQGQGVNGSLSPGSSMVGPGHMPPARIPSPSPLSQIARAPSPGIVGERMADNIAFNRSSSMSRVESSAELAAALQRLDLTQQQEQRRAQATEMTEKQAHHHHQQQQQQQHQQQQQQQRQHLYQMDLMRAEEEEKQQAMALQRQLEEQQQQRMEQHAQAQAAAAVAAAAGAPNMYAAAMYNQALATNSYYQNMMYAATPQYAAAALGLNFPMNPATAHAAMMNHPMMAAAAYHHPTAMPMGYDPTATYQAGMRAAAAGGSGGSQGNPPPSMGMHPMYKYGSGATSASQVSVPDGMYYQKGGVSPMYSGSPEQRSPYPRSNPVVVPLPPKQQQAGSSPGNISPIVSPGYYGSPPGLVMPYGGGGLVGSPVMGGAGPLSPMNMAMKMGGPPPGNQPTLPGGVHSGGGRREVRDTRDLRATSGPVPGMYQGEKSARAAAAAAAAAPQGPTSFGSGWQAGGGRETGTPPPPLAGGEESRGSSLLEEFKNSKTRRFELSDIVGHVVEFSADQHGSRFIQQKLETATVEEKSMVFQEVIPRALTLMTDVFGNYVIQKFFEHGTTQQRRQLASELVGHVLALSLQMYGCRVIQKALEVVDTEMQGILVSELDGHVMRCVRDQNGNHVVQKCIECVPAARIHFIVSSFHNQVVALSTHPYGCRVIQRVLEHCPDDQKQRVIMEEILRSSCTLAQDQYGNYVVQHVLEHGNPQERGEIIRKLAGNIVQMSQHKFASNVVEKCLEFGSAADRQILINEMLGTTEENEPLQAMMKDQFANYVVQKVLETCDEQQRAILLDRIKVHLHALKKYTYGKHIVARVEKLVAAGGKMQARDQAAALRREREGLVADRDSPRGVQI